MSTNYYKLAYPIAYLRVIRIDDKCSRVSVHAGCGTGAIDVRHEDLPALLSLFQEYVFSDAEVPMRTYWGGPQRGTVVEVQEELADDVQLISSYGRLLTVAQVKARDGAKRKDGLPTELFGFEEE